MTLNFIIYKTGYKVKYFYSTIRLKVKRVTIKLYYQNNNCLDLDRQGWFPVGFLLEIAFIYGYTFTSSVKEL